MAGSNITINYNDVSTTLEIATTAAGVTDHGALTGLADDDHTQYALLLGRSGGQTIIGGTASSNNLLLRSTSNATKGVVAFDQTGDKVIVGGTSFPAHSGITNTPTYGKTDGTDNFIYTDSNGHTHIGDGPFVPAPPFKHSSSYRLYFDARFGVDGTTASDSQRDCYIQAEPTLPGIQNQAQICFYANSTQVLCMSSVGGVVFNQGMISGTSSSWLLSGNTMRTTNTVPGFIRGEFNYIELFGELNTVGEYDIRIRGKNPFGGSTVSNICGFLNNNTIVAYVSTNGGFVFNETGADADCRIEGDTDANLFYTDASTDRIGIGTATPDTKLHVSGGIHTTGDIEIDGVLNHDGSTVGLYGVSPVSQASSIGQLTDSTTGTPSNTLIDVGLVFTQANINDNFASVLAKINALEDAMKNIGISA